MIEASDAGDIRVLRLAHGKASALDLELVVALREAIERAETDKAQAIVLTGTGHIFCAGVDLFRVADGGAAYVRRYLPAFTELTFALFATDLPLMVAANGHAMAGGAVLVAAGDYRLMAQGEGRFGYTELLVGVPFPPSALEVIRHATPPQHVQALLYSGMTVPPGEALARGLVDEVVEAGQLMPRALDMAQRFGSIAGGAFADTKRQLRGPVIARMGEREKILGAAVVAAWASDATHAHIRDYLARTVRKKRRGA